MADFWLNSSFSRVAILLIDGKNTEEDGDNSVMYHVGKEQIIGVVGKHNEGVGNIQELINRTQSKS